MSSPSYTSAFSAGAEEIAAILSGTSSAACSFDPEQFLALDNNASCYGPSIDYENHPDASGSMPADGNFPSGDLGIYSENNVAPDGTVSACSAAELNARMDGVGNRAQAALMSLASMVCSLTTSGQAIPVNATVDLSDEMTALGIADTVFSTETNAVSLTHDDTSGSDVYSYALSFTYLGDNIVVEMEFQPGTSSSEYHGRVSSLVNTSMGFGNCPDPEVTNNNSLLYEANSTGLILEARSGTYCGHDADGRVDGLPNPGDKYSDGSVTAENLTGWGNNLSIFRTNFDPTTLEGNVFLAWQAGPHDGNARIFNLNTEPNADDTDPAGDDSSDIDLSGEAYFGYGDDIEDTDGTIQGFICNWAGPNGDHDPLTEDAQFQSVTLDYSTGSIDAAISMIDYAPVNGCTYDYTGTETFIYDTNNDEDLTDEDPTIDIIESLLDPSDTDGDGTETIEETITRGGFTLPTAPANL
jgi:hypothetical protein